MTREQILRNAILDKYTSLRKFSAEVDIPYSSLITMLERGISGASFDTVLKICKKLNLNPEKI